MMKKSIKCFLFIALLFVAGTCPVAGQTPVKWQLLSFDEEGVYGAAVRKMHEAAKGMKLSRKPVTVALIGYGIDVKHNALKKAVWKNPKEKPNGKDDDKNGWVDDLNGWNFLGNDTVTLDRISSRGEREYLRLRDKYDDYVAVEGKVYRYDMAANQIVEAPMPEDEAEFQHFLRAKAESEIASAYGGVRLGKIVVSYIQEIDKRLKERFAGKKIGREDFQAVFTKQNATAVEKYLNDLVALMFMSAGSDDWDVMVEYAGTKFIPYQESQYERVLKYRTPREGAIIGDDPYDLNDKGYGNNNLLAENATYGSMLAGLIAAKRDNAEVSGAAPEAKIMTLRVDAGEQDESRVKDVALAIRYAVDKGASIIQLGKGNTLYPYPHSQWVDDALRYAESKGVLVVIPVMDLSYNLDVQPFYPNRHTGGGDLTNIITVAASDSMGNPFKHVNYSAKELDIFAPGVDIKSAYTNNAYAEGSGSAFAAAMVTGVAAFIKSYYPSITPAGMRGLLMDNVTPRGDVEVEKQFYIYRNGQQGRLTTDLFLFSELSTSGGILNAAKAFEAAGKFK